MDKKNYVCMTVLSYVSMWNFLGEHTEKEPEDKEEEETG